MQFNFGGGAAREGGRTITPMVTIDRACYNVSSRLICWTPRFKLLARPDPRKLLV